ncbi:MAG: CCA tRNA nucleotidyltransferase, partial [Planctomycetota bacterium]
MTRDDPNERPDLVERLPQELLGPVRHVAGVLGAAGHRAWVVGGAVRDLLYAERGRAAPVKDADLVSAALPDEVEALFPRTVAVGKSFGIVVVVVDGVEIEVATFREERGYSDRRRPDEIRFTDSLALDARRRDFTINALYLDPLDGQIEDPTGGLRDLESGRLRAVGRASDRFREDGLRILRMARFQARFALEAADGLHRAALDEADSLVGVSPERVLDELSKMVSGGGVRSAVRTLVDVGAAERVLPDWTAETAGARLRDLESLGDGPTLPGVLAALLGADGPDAARRRASLLRGSRDTVRRTGRVAELAAEIA